MGICYDNINPYSYLYLSNLQSERPKLPIGILRRYVIDANLRRCSHTTLSSTDSQEFPQINYRTVNGKHYNFLYTNAITLPEKRFFNSIQKVNVETGKIQSWEKTDYYPGEAIFVGKPDGQSECDGVLLSITYNDSTQNSSLVILDANTMEQIAEVCLPLYLPFGLHGNFYNL
jgi:carotenoid cleavage dioxygenase-like enzyme